MKLSIETDPLQCFLRCNLRSVTLGKQNTRASHLESTVLTGSLRVLVDGGQIVYLHIVRQNFLLHLECAMPASTEARGVKTQTTAL